MKSFGGEFEKASSSSSSLSPFLNGSGAHGVLFVSGFSSLLPKSQSHQLPYHYFPHHYHHQHQHQHQKKTTTIQLFLSNSSSENSNSNLKTNNNNDNNNDHDDIIYKGDYLGGIPLLFCSTLVSSFCANIVANPFDVIKSRIQNQKVQVGDSSQIYYNGSIDCLRKSVQHEGVMVLYKGFGPAFVKLAPYTVISLTLVDTMTKYMTGKDAL